MAKIKDRYKVTKNRVRRYRPESITTGVLRFWYKITVTVVKITMPTTPSVIKAIPAGSDDLR